VPCIFSWIPLTIPCMFISILFGSNLKYAGQEGHP
jgi:hypothetical protein